MPDWAIKKAVWGYRLRVLLNRPYRDAVTIEELLRKYAQLDPEWGRRHSCACGLTSSTHPLNGQRLACCPPQFDGDDYA